MDVKNGCKLIFVMTIFLLSLIKSTNSSDNNKVSITETSNMPSPIIESRKVESKLFNGHDKTRPNTYREIVR